MPGQQKGDNGWEGKEPDVLNHRPGTRRYAWARLWEMLLADDGVEDEPVERYRPVNWICRHGSRGKNGNSPVWREVKAA